MPRHVLLGAAVVTGGALVLAVWVGWARAAIRRHRRLEPHAATMELRDEPAGVVAYLVNGLELTPEAVAGSLLELAADGHLEVFQVSPEEHVLRRRRRRTTPPLSSVDRQLLELIDRVGSGADLPLRRLTQELQRESWGRHSAFGRAVHADAAARGLVQSSQEGAGTAAALIGAGMIAAGTVVALPFVAILTPVTFLLPLLAAAVLAGRGAPVLTDAGRAAGAHWLGVRDWLRGTSFSDLPAGAVAVWDHHLAAGAALGVTRAANRALVAQLRTELGVAGGIGLLRQLVALQDPARLRAFHARRRREALGDEVGPEEVFGPEPEDWWELVSVTGRAWPDAMRAMVTDQPTWARAALRRIDLLERGAPADLRQPVTILARRARSWVGDVTTRTTVGRGASWSAADERALDAFVAAVADHFGWEPSRHVVLEALVAHRP